MWEQNTNQEAKTELMTSNNNTVAAQLIRSQTYEPQLVQPFKESLLIHEDRDQKPAIAAMTEESKEAIQQPPTLSSSAKKKLKSKSLSLDPDIKNKERYVQKDELDEEWTLEIPVYDREDYAADNKRLLNGEVLLNVPATTMIFSFITRVLQTVVNDLN